MICWGGYFRAFVLGSERTMKKPKNSSKAIRRPRSRKAKKSPSDSIIERDRTIAKYIAMVVRNAMEDFHVAHLTDTQMRELNPIIRNAVYTALHAMRQVDSDPASAAFVNFAMRLIPDYWEDPELLSDYVRTVQFF